MRRAVWQWLLVGLALVWGASGCNCGNPPVESQLEVSFQQPKDGQRLALADDADPATDGFQFEVVAEARDTAGRSVKLASAKLELRTPSEATWKEGPEAVIDGGTIRFPGTLLQPRTNLLQVTVEEEGSHRTATQKISVTVSTEPPSVELTQPAEGQVLRETDDADPETAGYQLHFSVKSSGLAGKEGTVYCEQACGIPPTDFTVNSSGQTQVSVTLSQTACLAQQAECYAVVRPGGSTQDVQSAKRRITLDTRAPRVEVTSPAEAVSTHTFDVNAVVGCCEDGSQVTLTRDGAPAVRGEVKDGAVSFPSVVVPQDGRFSYVLRATDSGGNVTEKSFAVTVASAPATISLSVPASVTTDADGIATNGIQVDATATTNATAPDTEIEFYTTVTSEVGNPVRVPTTTAQSGGRTATLRVSLAEGSNSVRACVRNPALPTSCQTVTVNVATGRPTCRIRSPLDASAVNASGLVKPIEVETSASSVQVRVLRADGSVANTSPSADVSGGIAQVSAAEVGLPTDEGSYRLVADCGTATPGGVSQAVTVTRDTALPALTLEVSGDSGDGVLGPETQDTSPLVGTQVIVTAHTEPFTSVTLSGCATSNSFSVVADATGRAVLREVTVPSSDTCVLSVSATDLAGNRAAVDKTLSLNLIPGALSLKAPAADRVLGPSDGTPISGGGLTVDVKVGITTSSAGTLKLFLGTTQVGELPVAVGDTEKVFTGIALREGANVVRVNLEGAAGTTACVTSLLTVNTSPGSITLSNPATTSTFGLGDDLNAQVPGIQHNLRYTVNSSSAGARVDICSSKALQPQAARCRDGSDFYTLASNVSSFVSQFTFPDGQYSIKAVLEDGDFSESQEVALVVDSVRPRVTRIAFEGDKNGDAQLNADEQSTGDPVALVTFAGLEDDQPVRVYNETTGAVWQATATGGAARIVLSGLPDLQEATYNLLVVATDRAGNSNKTSGQDEALDPLNTEARIQLRVDRNIPTLLATAPVEAAIFGPSDDASTTMTGYQVLLSLTTSLDVGGNGVEVTVTPPGAVLHKTPAGGIVSDLITLETSGSTDFQFQIKATDPAGNSTTLVRTFTVDLDPPVLVVTSPSSGSTYDTLFVPVSAQVTGAEGATVNIFRGNRIQVSPSLTVSNGVASGTVQLPRGTHDLLFEVHDAAGNLASQTVTNVTVNFNGCDPRFTRPMGTPVTLIQKDDEDTATADLQYRFDGEAPACPGREVRLFRNGATTPEATTVADAATGAFSFTATLPDNLTSPATSPTTLRAEMDDGTGVFTSATVVVNVDLTPPGVGNVLPAENSLFFVADSNEAFSLVTPTPGYVKDRVPDGDADAQLSARVTGAKGGLVRVLYNGTDVASPVTVTPSSDDETVMPLITLPQNTSGTLEIVVRDAAGNEVRHTANAVVDVVPPANPSPQAVVASGAERAATVNVTWTAVGDDGVSGVPQGYDLRWSHEGTLPGGIKDDATFFRGRVRKASASLLPAGSTSFALTPLPPMETYSIQLRARDEVGNYSRFVAPQALANVRIRDVLDPGGNGSRFGYVVAANGNLDGVAGDDLVVSDFDENSNQGAVYVFSGGDGAAQTLLPPDTTLQTFGYDISIGNVGDAAGEGKPDLLVGAPNWSSGRGRVFLYFGQAAAGVKGVDPTPVEFRGTNAAGTTRFGFEAHVINDINQDGLNEVAISAPSENSTIGKVYIYFGRTRAAWDALRVDDSNGAACTVSTTACVIPTSKADRVINGEDATSSFGRWRGMIGLGDINGDGVPDFGVPVSRDTFNRYYIFSGDAVRTSPVPMAIPASSALQRLTQPTGTDSTLFNGFGMAAVGGLNLFGGAGPDLVVSRPTANTLFLYADGGATGFGTPTTILGSGNFGNSLALGDINQDGKSDLVVGTDLLTGGSAWVMYNSTTGYDALIGDFNAAHLVSPGAQSLGVSVAVGDFDGDGKPDIAAGDNLDSVRARVKIWY